MNHSGKESNFTINNDILEKRKQIMKLDNIKVISFSFPVLLDVLTKFIEQQDCATQNYDEEVRNQR